MKQRWEKVLYKDQGVPDNFVSPHFLSELRKNLYIRKYNLVSVMIDAGSIYQQLCCVSVFISFYFYLLFNWVSPVPASTVLMFFVITGYLLFWFFGTSEQVNLQRALFHIRTGLVIFTFSLILAPILHSLLATVSTDSIYAMAGLFFLLNWACTDYTTQLADYAYEPGSNTTAFSSSLLAALCLASRLPTPYHTFVLIAAGTVLFALWPSLVQVIRVRAGKAGQLCLTIFAFVFSNTFLWPIVYHEAPMEYRVLISVANLTLIVLINFIGPWVLVRMQRIKRNIHGPWDEAVVQQS